MWEDRLLKFVSLFAKRREEFEFALTTHTIVDVDAANLKLGSINEQTEALSRRYVGRLLVQIWGVDNLH